MLPAIQPTNPAASPGDARTELEELTPIFPVEVLAGEYAVEVHREGYQRETRAVSITARDTQTLDVPLVRVAASLFFVTEPAGVEVWVDGELRTKTSGSLAPESYEEIRARGIDPGRASAPTEVANLTLGSHAIELRLPCYETVRTTLDTSQPQDYRVDPVKMEDSVASLRLTSEQPGARIFRNSRFMQEIMWKIFRPATEALARIGLTFDRNVMQSGFSKAMGNALEDFASSVAVRGRETVPITGPLLVISNHPGTYYSLVISSQLGRDDLSPSQVISRSCVNCRTQILISSASIMQEAA